MRAILGRAARQPGAEAELLADTAHRFCRCCRWAKGPQSASRRRFLADTSRPRFADRCASSKSITSGPRTCPGSRSIDEAGVVGADVALLALSRHSSPGCQTTLPQTKPCLSLVGTFPRSLRAPARILVAFSGRWSIRRTHRPSSSRVATVAMDLDSSLHRRITSPPPRPSSPLPSGPWPFDHGMFSPLSGQDLAALLDVGAFQPHHQRHLEANLAERGHHRLGDDDRTS